jgi:two-component system phosphate regulon response regulator OmpR
MTLASSLARREPLPDNAPHVLLVDDDQRIRELLGRYLQDSGFRVTTAQDTLTARAAMRGLAFDLVILDVMMPGESGLDLARDLKSISPIRFACSPRAPSRRTASKPRSRCRRLRDEAFRAA